MYYYGRQKNKAGSPEQRSGGQQWFACNFQELSVLVDMRDALIIGAGKDLEIASDVTQQEAKKDQAGNSGDDFLADNTFIQRLNTIHVFGSRAAGSIFTALAEGCAFDQISEDSEFDRLCPKYICR